MNLMLKYFLFSGMNFKVQKIIAHREINIYALAIDGNRDELL